MEKETTAAATAAQEQTTEQQKATSAETAAAAGTTAKTYDQAYIDNLIAQQKQAQEAAVAEALKVASMDADSKAKYQKEQENQKLKQREADLARRELKVEARGVLEEKEVPAEFLDMLLGKDMKETKANVEIFAAAFDKAVQARVEKRLVGKTPQIGNGGVVSEAAAMSAEIDKYL